MKISELAEKIGAKVICEGCDREAEGCYIGDLLSLAMANVAENNVWITVQTNINTIAVASLTEAGAILLPSGLLPDENTSAKAREEKVYILSSEKTAYELAAMLSELKI